MGRKASLEQRAVVDLGSAPRFGYPFHVSRLRAWSFALAGAAGVAAIDWLSGPDYWLGPAYLMVIGFAAWSLGWRQALGLGLTVCAATAWINGLDIYPFGTVAAVWNLAMRVLAVTMIILLLDNARRSCEREWLLARTDPLTGALNRKAFFELVGRTAHSRSWSLLAYADLDGLKRLNDELGHETGDRSLEAFADCVKTAIRKDDLFARVGGDEFLVYMAVRDEEAGKSVAARLHAAMNRVTRDFSQDLSCSIGVLILAPGERSIDRELRLADELMYEAKQCGAALALATASARNGQLVIAHHTAPLAAVPAGKPTARTGRRGEPAPVRVRKDAA